MSRRSCNGLPTPRVMVSLVGLANIVVLAGIMALARVVWVDAQATPEAGGSVAGPCEAPPGIPVMAATPTFDAVDAGEPVATVVHDNALAAEVVAAVGSVASCWNAGEVAAVLRLVTPNFLQTQLGAGDFAEAEAALAGADPPRLTILDTDAVQTYVDGRVSIDVISMLGEHQYDHARWYLVESEDRFLLDEVQQLLPRPEGDTTLIGFSIADDSSPVAFDQRSEIAAAPVVILHGVNNGAERHLFTIVRLPEGMAGTPVPGALPPANAEFVGRLSLEPGEQQGLTLVNLTPGTYLLFDPAVEGSAATLTITEPVA